APDRAHVLGGAHERQGNEVHADRFAKAQHVEILVWDCDKPPGRAGDVEPLPTRNRAAHLDRRLYLAVVLADSVDPQPDGTVGEVDHIARIDRTGQAGPGDRHALLVTDLVRAGVQQQL